MITASFFGPTTLDAATPGMPAVTVDRPCLLVAEGRGDDLILNVTDPDLRLEDFRSRSAVTSLVLSQVWHRGDGFPDTAELVHPGEGTTRLAISCRDGRTVTLPLTLARTP